MLVPCASCDRHVCATAVACPFCRTAISRARIAAFVLALAGASCGSSAVYAGPPPAPPGDPNAAPTEPVAEPLPEPATPPPVDETPPPAEDAKPPGEDATP